MPPLRTFIPWMSPKRYQRGHFSWITFITNKDFNLLFFPQNLLLGDISLWSQTGAAVGCRVSSLSGAVTQQLQGCCHLVLSPQLPLFTSLPQQFIFIISYKSVHMEWIENKIERKKNNKCFTTDSQRKYWCGTVPSSRIFCKNGNILFLHQPILSHQPHAVTEHLECGSCD